MNRAKLRASREFMTGFLALDPSLVQLVRVTTDDKSLQLWAVAAAREEAVDCVLSVIPEGWSARLLDGSLRPREDIIRTMRPGEVRELCR